MSRTDYVVTPAELAGLAGAQVLDVRWALGEAPGTGRAAYLAGHIPGARYLDLEAVLTGPHTDARLGRHPLPDAERLGAGLGAVGVVADRPVVVYDVPGSSAASRAWWVLRWAGFDARVLDGGWLAWLTAGGAVETGDVAVAPTRLDITVGHLPTIDAAGVAAWPGTLIDVRAAARYRGETEPIDPVAGHIPGAINRPVAGLWEADGTLPAAESLRTIFGDLTKPVAVYCGSGITATQGVLALAVAGIDAALYPPSWSGWVADPTHPVAVGE